MRAVVQRVTRAKVSVDGQIRGQIDQPGLMVLLGVTHEDGPAEVKKMAEKLANLRVFDTEDGEASALDLKAPMLVVSQFTLYGSTVKGRRPSWTQAAPGPVAQPIYEDVVAALRDLGIHVETGEFGAMMQVELVNDGPYTLLVEL
ncbi:D-tyrosyl-tRNA(Tyr) deacylase [Boudabousia liubingyangii]|uniref:D-aminoacyl-tRNA deacylase n=1 Tax=Boudabousia liubingyangii TaxID=1921764 RepID=A0A1Q5PPX5_9ACTO|nr:D-aminoacyl-tRNA deacylase [Boudabousia liubingyangii]OKL49573.1 D-tyrosyl-tRNA(Tyr) deacylase [Boudabousia liubingyangii]